MGESGRNLKIRVQEHMYPSSKSSLSLHVKAKKESDCEEAHAIDKKSATVITQERNPRKRRFIESACIKAKRRALCNTGPSLAVSDTWDSSLSHVARKLDQIWSSTATANERGLSAS